MPRSPESLKDPAAAKYPLPSLGHFLIRKEILLNRNPRLPEQRGEKTEKTVPLLHVIDRRMRKTGFSLILSLHRSSVFSIPDSSSMSKSASIKAFFSSSSFPESQEATALSKMRLDLLKSSSRRKSPP